MDCYRCASLPLRECGLKLLFHCSILGLRQVTPLAGVWIEIPDKDCIFFPEIVTPLAGVWIEIPCVNNSINTAYVTPLAGVWIEIELFTMLIPAFLVTPLAGVWIEIAIRVQNVCLMVCHSPCGSVD